MTGLSGRLAILGVLVASQAVLGQGAVAYDNTVHVDDRSLYFSQWEYGDEINLAPGFRNVSKFTFKYYADFNVLTSPSASFKVHFFRNDGTDANTNPKKQPILRPGTLLWESNEAPLVKGFSIVRLDVPDILVPGKFTWTVKFSGITGDKFCQAGLVLADPPTIAAPLANGRFGSYWDAWVRNKPNKDDSWSTVVFGTKPTDPHANFYARVEVVRDPFALNIRLAPGHRAELSWPRLLDVLESAETLDGSWSEATGPLVNISVNPAGKVVVDNRPKSQARFYRLRLGAGPLASELAGPAAGRGIQVQAVNDSDATYEPGRVDSPKPGTSVTLSSDEVLRLADPGRPDL